MTDWAGAALGLAPTAWISLAPDVLDAVLTAYILWLFSMGAPFSHGTYALSAIQAARPNLRGHLRGAWRALQVWQRSEPTRMRVPLSWPLLRAIVVLMITEGWLSTAAIAWLAFHCLLRPEEAAGLLRRHLVLPMDGHMVQAGVVALVDTKTANRGVMVQSVVIFDANLLSLLSRLFGCLRPGDNLCPGGLTSFRRRLAYATSRLGASSIGITAGSFRAGGPTYSFECGMDLAEIQHRGRWDNSRTLSHYIQSANAAIAFSKLDVATSKHIAQVGTFFSALIEGADAASQPSG